MQKQGKSDRAERISRRRPVRRSACAAPSNRQGARRPASRAESERESDPAQQNTKAPREDCVGPTACRCVVGLAAHPARIPASNAQRARIRHRAGPRVGQSRAGFASRPNSSRRTVGTPVRRATPRRALERTHSPARCQSDTQSTDCRTACLTTPRRQGLRPTLPGRRSVQLTSCRTVLTSPGSLLD